MTPAHSDYRPDIDGLRAVAVIAVVLFHARYEFFSGGFVGVDVFFVISGFLITGIIVKHEGSSAEFFKRFYERRIRRLFPPVIPVLIFTSAVVYWLSPPEALDEYARSLVAFLAFVSNWFFWSEVGYFGGPAQFKPLLHTWSLSIEEQFYLLFPVVVLFLARRGRRPVVWFFAVVLAISLVFNIWLVLHGDLEAAFFNSFGRFWEFALGSLLACGVLKSPSSEGGKNILGVAGILGIGVAVFVFDANTAFPGFAALLPTLGAAAIILAGGGVAGRFLSMRATVSIGLISYSLYLWHWPIFLLIDLVWSNPTPLHFAVGIGAAAGLSVLSYHFIEMPVRKSRAFPTRPAAYALFAAAGGLFMALGVTGTATGGLPDRFPKTVADYTAVRTAQIEEFFKAAGAGGCWVSSEHGDMQAAIRRCAHPEPDMKNVLVVGDSHAAHLMPGLRAAFPDVDFDLLAANSCPLVTGYRTDSRPACMALIEWIRDPDNFTAYDALVLSVRGLGRQSLLDFTEWAVDLAGRVPQQVMVFGPIQAYSPTMPDLFPTLLGKTRDEIDFAFDEAIQDTRFPYDAMMKEALAGSAAEYVSLTDILCAGGIKQCRHLDTAGWPILVDASHMSAVTSATVVQQLRRHGLRFLQ